MARAIPRTFAIVPFAFTAHVSTGSVYKMKLTFWIFVGADSFAVMEDNSPFVCLQITSLFVDNFNFARY
ncbi:hypothetical protein D3C86_2190410 [compost metagenome]